jgi:hypothetical protein
MTAFTDHVLALAHEEDASPERRAVLEAITEGEALTPEAEQRLGKLLDEGTAPHIVLEASWAERRRGE